MRESPPPPDFSNFSGGGGGKGLWWYINHRGYVTFRGSDTYCSLARAFQVQARQDGGRGAGLPMEAAHAQFLPGARPRGGAAPQEQHELQARGRRHLGSPVLQEEEEGQEEVR